MNADENAQPVPASKYSGRYYLESCGGAEFFERYGPQVPKPPLAYSIRRMGLSSGMEILDIGCGRGEVLFQARALGARAVGTDYARAALELAGKVSGCPVLLCDAKELPFRAASFDRVFFLGVIDHLRDWELERCFAEIARVLKPGGAVAVHTCANRLYYKNWTYGLRRAAAGLARGLGMSVSEPAPPRSAEDAELHVNEHSYGDLARFFARIGWGCEITPMPNYKLLIEELYGVPLPEGFPLRPAPAWKKALHRSLLFRFPLDRVLAREFFVLARPGHA